jgi:hypothetical protein
MSAVSNQVLSQPPSPAEEENLFLPSSFSEEDRSFLGLSKLALDEALLREAQACDCILQLRLTLKAISVLQYKRQWNVVGQRKNTRARARIHSLEAVRDHHLLVYNTTRTALIALKRLQPDDERLPHLTREDLSRKSTIAKRQTGDTYRPDGKLWALRPSKWSETNGESSIPANGGTLLTIFW